jgi:hypothetical protein
MPNLDEILKKTITKNIPDKEIASQTKNFHNKFFDNKHELEIENNDDLVNNYVVVKDYSILRKNMMVGYIKKSEKNVLCEGRILNIIFNNNDEDKWSLKQDDISLATATIYLEIYNFISSIKEIIDDKYYDFYIYNKFTKEDSELQKYSYVDNLIILEKGQLIKYINKKRRNKVSCAGKIEKIVYDKDKTKIEILELYNFMTNRKWKIKVDKYYVYVFDNVEKQLNAMDKMKNDILGLIKD